MPTKNSFFCDVNNSKFDLISEIQEDEFDSATKKEDLNFECDYSSINLDISRNSVFWAENTKILNEIEREDFVIKSERPIQASKEPFERVILKEPDFFLKDNFNKEAKEASKFKITCYNLKYYVILLAFHTFS